MNYYIYRTIGIFLVISFTLILGTLVTQYYYFDHEIIKKEQSELENINLLFKESSNQLIQKEFNLVTFLSKTNYFLEALKIKERKELFKLLNTTKSNKQGDLILFIIDKEQRIRGSLQARKLMSQLNKTLIAQLEQKVIIPLNEVVVYLIPYRNKQGKILGHLGGILPILTIKKIINYKYKQLTDRFSRISSELVLIKINTSKQYFYINEQPFRLKTINDTIYNNIFTISKRLLMTVLLLIIVSLILTSLLLRKTIKEPMINILSLVDSIGKGKINYNFYKKIKDKDYLLIGDALLKMNKSQSKLEMINAQAIAYRERLDILEYFKHNLKSPLVTIENIFLNLKEKISSQEHKLLALAFERIENITSSPVEPNRIKISKNIVSLDRVLSNIITQKKIEFLGKGRVEIYYKNNLKQGNDLISMDPSDLREVVSNIINNSMEAIENEGEVLIVVNQKKENICLTITDNGSGISKENLGVVFSKNYSTKIGVGRGIGLYHAHNISRKHNLGLNIKSELGLGTEINLIFPAINKSKNKYRSIVLIDDDELVSTNWMFKAEKNNINLQTFLSYRAFKEEYHCSGEESLLFIDSFLKFDSANGESISKEINDDYSFYKIFIVTGIDSFLVDEFPWITKCLGKRFPGKLIEQYQHFD